MLSLVKRTIGALFGIQNGDLKGGGFWGKARGRKILGKHCKMCTIYVILEDEFTEMWSVA